MTWLTGSGKFKDDQFEEDKEKLRTFYAENGYVDFEIQQIEFEYPKTNRMEIDFTVVETQRMPSRCIMRSASLTS